MSWGAENFVRWTQRAPGGSRASALTEAEARVMAFLAYAHDDDRGCALRSMGAIAQGVNKSEGHSRRLIAALVAKERLRRHAAVRGNDKSQTSNEYEIVGYSQSPDEAARRKADARLYTKPQRSADQVMVRRGGRQRKQMQLALGEVSGGAVEGTAGLFADVRGGDAGENVAALGDVSGEQRAGTVEALGDVSGESVVPLEKGCGSPVENARACLPPPNTRCLPPANIRCLPIDLVIDLSSDSKRPYPRSQCAAAEEKLPDIAKARASATASARATATTQASEAAKPQAGSAGSAGMRSGRARGLAGGPVGGLLGYGDMLDGEDAAVAAEVERVMLACGWTPGPLGTTIREALRLRMQSVRCCAADAGDLAIQRWSEYTEDGPYLRYMVQPRKFFREGVWLAPRSWPVDARLRNPSHPDARMGMYRR